MGRLVPCVAAAALLAACGSAHHPASPATARSCLAKEGFRVLGGPRAPDDTNAPDTELIVGTPQAGAFLAFYNELRRAERYAPGIAKRTRRFGGAVERHGKLTILWVRGKDSHDAKRIRSCAGA